MADNGNGGKAQGGAGLNAPWRVAIWGGAAALLALPLAAMQFSAEVRWGPEDFVIMGALLATVCAGFEIAARLSGAWTYRAASGLALVAGFLLIWINLAVGIIGNEGNPANLMFLGVIAIGPAGAFLSRFRAAGMARTLLVMAGAQLAAGAAAILGGFVPAAEGTAPVIGLSVAFATIWLSSAALYRKAAEPADAPVRA